jgi:hypothetical protein
MILIPLLIPIGLLLFWYAMRVNRENRTILQNYIKREIENNVTLSGEQKHAKATDLLYQNGYRVLPKANGDIKGEKKVFSIGLFFAGIFVLYIPYFFFWQKPETLIFKSQA